MDKQELFEKAKKTIIDADEDNALKLIEEAQEHDFDLLELLISGFGSGNEVVGEQFDKGAISLPELIYAAEVMKNVTNAILEIIDDDGSTRENQLHQGTVLLATVKGDVHDIGKGIVASTLRNAGFSVIDIGCEVSVEEIVDKAKQFNVDIIGTSALLTSTLTEQKKLEKYLVDIGERDNFITMVGGAPCTNRWARKIGADGYSEDAIDAVTCAKDLIRKRK